MAEHVMLDLETMGTVANSAIVEIGAVKFSREKGIGERFSCRVDLQSCIDAGLVMDAGTVIWWLKQSDNARFNLTGGEGLPLAEALSAFADWIDPKAEVWGNGSDFDNAILSTAYRAAKIEQPWGAWSGRCYRTIKNTRRDIKLERVGTYHCAVDDAESQARHLLAIWAAQDAAA